MERRDILDKKDKNFRVLGDVAFQFQKYLCKFLFPRENPLFFNFKLGKLNKLVGVYLDKHFEGQEKETERGRIEYKIKYLGLGDIEKMDYNLKKLKQPRLATTHNTIDEPFN